MVVVVVQVTWERRLLELARMTSRPGGYDAVTSSPLESINILIRIMNRQSYFTRVHVAQSNHATQFHLQFPPINGARSSSSNTSPPWLQLFLPRPTPPLTTHTSARIAKASEDQWMKLDDCWWAKMANSDQAIAIEAGRSPSGEENA